MTLPYEAALQERTYVYSASGNNVFILCPFHEETDASCSVNLSHGGFHCFGCGEEGPFYKLIAQLDGISEDSAKLVWADGSSFVQKTLRGIREEMVISTIRDQVIDHRSFLNRFGPLSISAEKYLQIRGISKEVLELFGLRWGGSSSRWCNRIIIPVYDWRGKLRAFSGRTIIKGRKPKTMKFGVVKNVLFGEFLIEKKLSCVILVEGEIDCMYLVQLGYSCLAVMGTSELSSVQLRKLVSVTAMVYISYDGDERGREAAVRDQKILSRLLPTVTIDFPIGFDPNSLGVRCVDDLHSLYYSYGIRRVI